MTEQEVAKVLKVSTETLRKWRRRVPAPIAWVRLGDQPGDPVRYTKSAVEMYVRKRMRR